MKKYIGKIPLKIIKKTAEILIIAVAIYYIGKFIWQGWPQVVSNIGYAKWNFVFFGFCLFFVYFILRSWAWQIIMRILGAKLSFQKANYIWFLSEFSRYVPGNVWSFLGRVYLSDKEKVPKRITSISLILEIFYLVGSSLGLGIIFFLINPAETFQIMWWMITITGIIILILINPKIFLRLINRMLAVIHKKPVEVKLNFWESLGLFILYTFIWISYGLASYFIAAAFVNLGGISVLWLICSFVLAWAIGYLSFITPMGLGVREATIITMLKTVISSTLASLVALVTRIFLIFSELIMLGIMVGLNKLIQQKDFISHIKKYAKENKHTILLWTLILLYCAYFIGFTFLRHANFLSSRYDLGNMDQTIWDTAHGNFFQLTNPEIGTQVSRFSIHSDIFLILLAPLYMVYSSPYILLFLQSVILALGALPVFWLGRDILKNKSLALAVAFAYLMYPGTQWANIFDFHAITLATSFLLFAFYFAYKKRYIPFIVMSILAIMTKETVAFSIMMIALYIIIAQKNWKLGTMVGALSLLWFGLLLGKIMPEARDNATAHFALGYYKYFGDTPQSIFKTLISHPTRIIDYISSNNRWYYFILIFAPVGFLGIFTPLALLALPPILINILSDQWQMSSINYQYTGDVTPFVFIATIFGLAWVIKLIQKLFLARGKKIQINKIQTFLCLYIIAIALFCSWKWSPLPLAKGAETWPWIYRHPSGKYLTGLAKEIPNDYSVSATNRMSPHFTERKTSYLFPNGIEQADYIIVEKNYPLELRPAEEMNNYLSKINNDNRYIRIYVKGDIEVFKKKGVK